MGSLPKFELLEPWHLNERLKETQDENPTLGWCILQERGEKKSLAFFFRENEFLIL
jgi:hypothetical protein